MTLNVESAIQDFQWIMKLLNSAETKLQVETAISCLTMWERKHTQKRITKDEYTMLSELKNDFWTNYRNKTIKY